MYATSGRSDDDITCLSVSCHCLPSTTLMAISTSGRAFLNRSISAWYQLARLPLPTVRFNFVVAPAALALAAAGADATEPDAPAADAADDAATEAAADAAGADEDAG